MARTHLRWQRGSAPALVGGVVGPEAPGGYLDDTALSGTDFWAYTGTGWQTSQHADEYGGSDHYTGTTGDYALLTFVGTSGTWIGSTDFNLGKVTCSVDGGSTTTVDCYSASRVSNLTLFSTGRLSQGSHTMKLLCSGTQNAASSGQYFIVDASFIRPAPPVTVPGPPTSPTASAGNTTATVTWVAPANNGGSPVLDYQVTSSPATTPVTASASPITYPSLANGTPYTFTVTARNVAGRSVPSVATAPPVTPSAGSTFVTRNVVGGQPGPLLLFNGQQIQFVGLNYPAGFGCDTGESDWVKANADLMMTSFRSRGLFRVFLMPGADLVAWDVMLDAAERHGLFLTPSFCESAGNCDSTGAKDQNFVNTIANGFTTGGTNNQVTNVFSWIQTVLTRTSTVTGRTAPSSTAIAWWECMNENAVTPSGPAFYGNFAGWIKSFDPNHLVCSGSQPEWAYGSQAAYQSAHSDSRLDICSMHEYDGTTIDNGNTGYVQADGTTSNHFVPCIAAANALAKPLFIGEFGGLFSGGNQGVMSTTALSTKITNYLNQGAAGTGYWDSRGTAGRVAALSATLPLSPGSGGSSAQVNDMAALVAVTSPHNGG